MLESVWSLVPQCGRADKDPIGNRTSDHPACNAVPRPIALPPTPLVYVTTEISRGEGAGVSSGEELIIYFFLLMMLRLRGSLTSFPHTSY